MQLSLQPVPRFVDELCIFRQRVRAMPRHVPRDALVELLRHRLVGIEVMRGAPSHVNICIVVDEPYRAATREQRSKDKCAKRPYQKLSTVIWPPIISTSREEIVSPKPVPP